MDFGINNKPSTPMFYVADKNQTDDEAYVEAVMSLIQSDESIEDIRRRQYNEADEGMLNAIVDNIGKTPDATSDWAAENTVASYAALTAYEKARTDVDVINKEVADLTTMNRFRKNPQAAYNALSENLDKYEDISVFDNRYYKTLQEIDKVVDVEGFQTSILARIGRDVLINYAGGKMAKAASPLLKYTGKALSSYGAGPATDVAMLGSSIQELKEETRIRFLATQTASDEEYPQALADLIDMFENTNKMYHAEMLEAIEEGPSVYDDAGGLFTAKGLQMYGATPSRILKGISTIRGKNVPTTTPASEKLVQTPSRALVPYKEQLPDMLDSDGVASAIENRKTGTALVPYRDNPVVAVNEGRPILALEDDTKTVTYLPTGEKITYLGAPEEMLTLPKSSTKLLEDVNESFHLRTGIDSKGKYYDYEREWLPEKRRVRYTDNNNGRGYTHSQAEEIVRQRNQDILRYKYEREFKTVYDPVTHSYVTQGKEPEMDVSVSAATKKPFTLARHDETTIGTGEGGQRYGGGSYASIEEPADVSDLGPASRNVYVRGNDYGILHGSVMNSFNQVAESGKYSASALQRVFNKIYGFADEQIWKNPKYSNQYKDLVDMLNTRIQDLKAKLKEAAAEDQEFIQAQIEVYNNSLKEMKKAKTGAIMTWNIRKWEPESTIDQRGQRGTNYSIIRNQHPEVRKALQKVMTELDKELVKENIISIKGMLDPIELVVDSTDVNGIIFEKLLSNWNLMLDLTKLRAGIKYFEEQYPWWYRLALNKLTDEELLQVGLKRSEVHNPEHLKQVDVEALKRKVKIKGQQLLKASLKKNGIKMGLQSNTNMVLFDEKLQSRVQKQEYNINGVHHQRILDSGSVMRYDTDLQAFVIDTYVSTGGGKGRRPIIVHKEKLSTMDPKRNHKMKKDDND